MTLKRAVDMDTSYLMDSARRSSNEASERPSDSALGRDDDRVCLDSRNLVILDIYLRIQPGALVVKL